MEHENIFFVLFVLITRNKYYFVYANNNNQDGETPFFPFF